MPAAEERRAGLRGELLWVGGLLAVALILRLWGVQQGLPFVYNADENAHFVPRAIGMFGHSYNPEYFINPPGFTYLLHVLFAVWFGGRTGVSDAYAADPTDVFTAARSASAVLGTLAVGFLYMAGRELTGDRRVGFAAAALFAVAFLPVHYAHFALNDVPTLAPLCLALWFGARVYRRGGWVDFAIAGIALGLACATKYTAGIVLLVLVAAAVAGAMDARRAALGCALLGACGLVGFLIANPYALLDYDTFRDGLDKQSSASSDGGGKLGLAESHGLVYYAKTLSWGLGVIPALAALGGCGWLLARDRRLAAVLVPAPLLFLLFMGTQDRFFARWMLPVYPLLCLLAAVAAIALVGLVRSGRWQPWALGGAVALLVGQGLVYSVHNDAVLARADTRELARKWMVANVPEGEKVVIEPVMPDQWAQDPGRPSQATGNGNRWIKWRTSRSRVLNDGTLIKGRGRRVKLEDYERTTRPELVGSYARGGFCYVLIGSTQYGRAYAEPDEVPNALRYYEELRRRGELVYRVTPWRNGKPKRFSFDGSFNAYELGVSRMGPEIRIYRLRGCAGGV